MAFPKLVHAHKQHTFVETDEVRYMYRQMEDLYLLLVTNKKSNIIEDLDTLRLLSKLVWNFLLILHFLFYVLKRKPWPMFST